MLSQEKLKQMLGYNPDTGAFAWKVHNARASIGDEAGCKTPDGYIVIGVNGKTYKAHRLAWLYIYGHWPESCITHTNKVRHDNRIDNLKYIGYVEDTSGFYWNRSVHKWQAQISIDGIQIDLGFYPTEEAARAAYLNVWHSNT